MNNEITVLIVNFNSSEFIDLSLYALSKLTKNPYKVLIIDNGSKISDYKKLEIFCSKYENYHVEREETDLRGSTAHGTALNKLTSMVDTPYFSILDADATWLIKDWDEICINKLDDKVKVIGTQAPQGKPQDFPLMFTILFDTEIFKSLNIDFRPNDLTKVRDTGWEMREKYHDAGYIGENIILKNTREYKDGPLNKIICGEYYLEGVPHIFASHFGRGSTFGASKYNKGMPFFYRLPFLGKFLRQRKGAGEKKLWLQLCKKIIDSQV